MSEVSGSDSSLALAEKFMKNIVAVCANPANEIAFKSLVDLDIPMAERFMQYPVTTWNMSREFKPVTLTDGIDWSRARSLADPQYPEQGLKNTARGTLISFGSRIPLSDAIKVVEYPEAYGLINETLTGIGGDQRTFASFAFKRIRSRLFTEYCDSRRGYNFNQLGSDVLEANIKSAFEVIGYPAGVLGHMAVSLRGILPRYASRLRYGD